MKSKDQQLLEEAYNLIQARLVLESYGYTSEEIDTLIARVWDAVKKVGQKVGRYAAIGATAAGMMGGSMARGDDASDRLKDIQTNAPKLVQDVIDKSDAEFKVTQQSEDQLISSTAQKAFGDTLSKEGMNALKSVLYRIDRNDSKKSDKIVQIIQGAAKKLDGNGQDKYKVYSAASEIQFNLK